MLRIDGVEKRSAVLENAAGLARGDAYVDSPVTKINGGIGVCLYIGGTNFALPRTLYKSKSHQH